MEWFAVDRKGLAQLLEQKGKSFVLYELIQNTWDERTTRVDVTLERVPNTRLARVEVRDDNPDGFKNLAHAFTLFAASEKKADAQKRGRFNLGEKLVLALCKTAQIVSTTGGVSFDDSGRHALRRRTESGSVFTGELPMTAAEMEECAQAVAMLLPPQGIETRYNGQALAHREPLREVEASLATEIADAEGVMRGTTRKTTVRIVEPREGDTPMLFEMGIPVAPTGDRWHLDVQQKVPLNFNRDNVPAAYLAKVRALAVEAMAEHLTTEDANAPWVREAMQRNADLLSDQTVQRLADLRFGEKRVIYDPSDAEANALAVSRGYVVVHGSQMSKEEWQAVRRSGAMLPAGQVTPSPKPYSPDGTRGPHEIAEADWTPGMRKVASYARELAREVMQVAIDVRMIREFGMPFSATYGGRQLTFNVGRLGKAWFDGPLEAINDLLIHEFGHEYCSNHLSADYYSALTRLGAKLTSLALRDPSFFGAFVD